MDVLAVATKMNRSAKPLSLVRPADMLVLTVAGKHAGVGCGHTDEEISAGAQPGQAGMLTEAATRTRQHLALCYQPDTG